MRGIYPWTLALGVVVLVVGLVLLANGFAIGGAFVALVGAVLVIGSLFARVADVRPPPHDEMLAALREQQRNGDPS